MHGLIDSILPFRSLSYPMIKGKPVQESQEPDARAAYFHQIPR